MKNQINGITVSSTKFKYHLPCTEKFLIQKLALGLGQNCQAEWSSLLRTVRRNQLALLKNCASEPTCSPIVAPRLTHARPQIERRVEIYRLIGPAEFWFLVIELLNTPGGQRSDTWCPGYDVRRVLLRPMVVRCPQQWHGGCYTRATAVGTRRSDIVRENGASARVQRCPSRLPRLSEITAIFCCSQQHKVLSPSPLSQWPWYPDEVEGHRGS